jgi:DNA-binding NtrC family response regulator
VSSRVLVFSADELRSKILKKVLDRNGFECIIFNRILETHDEIVPYSPEVVIVDTERCFSEEIDHLKNICKKLKYASVIVLGKDTVIDRFRAPFFRKYICLSNPIDLDLIVLKIEKIVSEKRKKWKFTDNDIFEKTLKHLLHLD